MMYMLESNLTISPSYIPFDQCQNALFEISAFEENTKNTPIWLSIDQLTKSIHLNLSLINSVGSFNISLYARLITFNVNSTDTSKFTTRYFVEFNFVNTNCQFMSSNATYYLVVGKITIFMFNFTDEEGDNIIISANQNDLINFFVQSSNNPNQYKIRIQGNEVTNKSTFLTIMYTDSYHQDSKFIKLMNLKLYLFEVEPPSFASDLPIINIDRWTNSTVMLPNIIDPNNLSWSIEFEMDTPQWITLKNNNALLLNSADLSFNISETTLVTLKLINEKNAWKIYSLTIKLESYFYPSFTFINNITVNYNKITEINLNNQSSINDIYAVDWTSNLTISWIKYEKQNSTLQLVSFYTKSFNQCAKLSSTDSCHNNHYSNEFVITIKNSLTPPAIGNTFGPLNVYVGESKLFLVPNDLFISDSQFSLRYTVSVLSWSINSTLFTNIAKSDKDGLFYLYIQSLDAKTCLIIINAIDSNNQSAETNVQVNALNWASKDWSECKSQYQSDWVKWKENYKLGVFGVWYRNTIYFPSSVNSLYDIWGLIILVSLSISMILILIIGLRSLYLVEFGHTIIIFIASSSLNQGLIKLISWFQIIKFDFGFIDQLHIRNFLSWNIGSTEMADIQFYWQSLLLNYFCLFLVIIISSLFLLLIKGISIKFKKVAKIYKYITNKFDKYKISWIFIYLFLPFLWINLLSDSLNIHDHTFYSLTSLAAFLTIFIFLMIKYPEIFTINFTKNIDGNGSPIFILFSILKSICHAFLFLYRNQTLRKVFLFIEFALHLPFIFISFIRDKEINLFELYSTKMRGVKNY